ncbi:hypothetical protein [Streptomyces sp. CAU 1734]|uniref:hypothetical protein n=1 Tax=Streptomyces sp. CAU 1734 TaxID=3140360 RepID=UPI00326080DE
MAAHRPTTTQARDGVGVRLPWWALALPVLAFVALFGLMTDPAQARSHTAGDAEAGFRALLVSVHQLLTR